MCTIRKAHFHLQRAVIELEMELSYSIKWLSNTMERRQIDINSIK